MILDFTAVIRIKWRPRQFYFLARNNYSALFLVRKESNSKETPEFWKNKYTKMPLPRYFDELVPTLRIFWGSNPAFR